LLSSDFERLVPSLARFVGEFEDYNTCCLVLEAMAKLRCKGTCRAGGGGCGPTECRIRDCSQNKGLAGCWECDEVESCSKLSVLVPVHGDAPLQNILAIRRLGVEGWLKGKRSW